MLHNLAISWILLMQRLKDEVSQNDFLYNSSCIWTKIIVYFKLSLVSNKVDMCIYKTSQVLSSYKNFTGWNWREIISVLCFKDLHVAWPERMHVRNEPNFYPTFFLFQGYWLLFLGQLVLKSWLILRMRTSLASLSMRSR